MPGHNTPPSTLPGSPATGDLPKQNLSDEETCAPDRWRNLFEYRQETNEHAEFEVLTHEKFYEKSGGAANQLGLCILSRYKGAGRCVHLRSRFLRDVFRKVVGKIRFEGVNVKADCIEIDEPYCPLFHCLEEMKDIAEGDLNASQREKADFVALYKLCTVGFIGDGFKAVREDLQQGVVTYDSLWALFQRNELLVVNTNGRANQPNIMRMVWVQKWSPRNEEAEPSRRKEWSFEVIQVSWDNTLKKFRHELQLIKVSPYPGARQFHDLLVSPLRLHPDEKIIKKTAEVRGDKWLALCHGEPKSMAYKGPAQPMLVDRMSMGPFAKDPETIQLSGRVVVDPGAMSKAARYANLTSQALDRVRYADEDPEDPAGLFQSGRYEAPSPDLSLCPAVYPVFALDEQEWYHVALDGLEEINWQPEAFDKLEMPKERKDLLATLTRSHMAGSSRRSTDMISGKGTGLVFLFYGPPGVGKTLTAEALAELTQKPLYRINLGTFSEYSNWEGVTEHMLDCASSWKSILLIDEAEVILEERAVAGRKQNTWVSVFLRKLEYYKGILVLTTNILNIIDEAFVSRVSVAIEFQELGDTQRLKIWKNFLDRMDGRLANKRLLLQEAETWSQEPLNARQIRNIILTAETLVIGRGRSAKMEPYDIESVLNLTTEFSNSFRSRSDGKQGRLFRKF